MNSIKSSGKKISLILVYMTITYFVLQQDFFSNDYDGIIRIMMFCVVSIIYYFLNSKLSTNDKS